MNAVRRLFVGDQLVKLAFAMGPGLAKLAPSPKPDLSKAPGEPVSSPQSRFAPVDVSKYISNEGGNYNMDVFNAFPHPLQSYNPAFTNNLHTLMINAHGGEGTNSGTPFFRMESQPVDSSPIPGYQSGRKRFSFGLSDVARGLGPATNSIHNLILGSCHSGGCAPQEAKMLFPNATNIVSTLGPDDTTTEEETGRALSGSEHHMLTSWQPWNKTNPPSPAWLNSGLMRGSNLLASPFKMDKMLGRTNKVSAPQ